jgi:hypothetical protein
MTIIHTADGFAVDQVPIEDGEPGEAVLTHLPDGSPTAFIVEIKRINIDKAAGTALIGLQAARETDTHDVGLVATIEAPVGTLAHRIIAKPQPEE